MSQKYRTMLTNLGKEKLAALITGEKLVFTEMAFGDGERELDATKQSLQNEKHREKIWETKIVAENSNRVNVKSFIPRDVGGFWIREVGIYDSEEDLIAIGKVSDTYKPISDDGSDKELLINMILEIDNIENISINISEGLVYITKKDLNEVKEELEDKIDNLYIPDDVDLSPINNKIEKLEKDKAEKNHIHTQYATNTKVDDALGDLDDIIADLLEVKADKTEIPRDTTVIIANHDSNPASKMGADYVFELRENVAAGVNKIIKELKEKSHGGNIFFAEGIYSLTEPIYIESGVNIKGVPGVTQFVAEENFDKKGEKSYGAVIISKPKEKSEAFNTHIENIIVFPYPETEMLLHGFKIESKVTLTNCTAMGFQGRGFVLSTKTNSIFYIKANNCRSIYCKSGGFDISVGTILNNCSSDDDFRFGIRCTSMDCFVNNCYIRETNGYGIEAYDHGIISNCKITKTKGDGIRTTNFKGVCVNNILINSKINNINKKESSIVENNYEFKIEA